MKNKKTLNNTVIWYYKDEKGQVVMAAVMIFLVLSLTVVLGIAIPISAQIKNSVSLFQTKRGLIAADALADEALYRLNQGRALPSTMVLSMNGASSTAQISNITGGKQVMVLGESGAIDRYSKSRFVQNVGIAINYGLQVGNGGLEMSGGPTIYGNVFSNGNVVATGGSTVTGSLTAASTYSLDNQVEVSDGLTTPSNVYTLGTATGPQTIAQSFTVSTSTPITSFEFYLKKTGAPANASVRIYNSSGVNVGSTQVGSTGSLSAALVSTAYGWTKVYPYTPITLVPGTTYWLTIQYAGSNTNYYTFGVNDNIYGDGSLKLKNKTGSYYNPSVATQDLTFKVFSGGLSVISGINIGGFASAGIVNTSNVSGNLYCQEGASNNKACNTSQPIPAPLALPITNSIIQSWKEEASAGRVMNSTWTLGGATATSTGGALKINGNLIIGAGATLTLEGPLYVTGKIEVGGGAKIVLANSYGTNDEKIVAERIDLIAGGLVTGNGQAGSYVIMAADGNDCPSGCYGMTKVITASGGTGSVVLFAPNGTIEFTGGASAKSAVAKKMILSGGTTLVYEAGLASITFGNTGSGSWNVESWKEVEQ